MPKQATSLTNCMQEEVLSEVVSLLDHTQSLLDVHKQLLRRACDDLLLLQQNLDNMPEKEICRFLEQTVDYIENCGASIEVVS